MLLQHPRVLRVFFGLTPKNPSATLADVKETAIMIQELLLE